MRTYQVSEPIDVTGERAILKSLRNHFEDKTAVSVELASGKVSVEDSADPQIVLFAIEGAGYTVDRVTDAARDDEDAGEFDPDEPIDSAVSTEDEAPALVETIDPQPITPPDDGDGRH